MNFRSETVHHVNTREITLVVKGTFSSLTSVVLSLYSKILCLFFLEITECMHGILKTIIMINVFYYSVKVILKNGFSALEDLQIIAE